MDASPLRTNRLIGQFRDNPPAAILIDLYKLPSHGRAVAVVVRSGKSTRHIPIVFAGGVKEKIERALQQVPGAIFTDWTGVASALKKAIKKKPVDLGRAKPYMEQYTGSSLVQKLGFKPDMRAALLGAPDGFDEQLGELPEGVEFQSKMNNQTNMTIWFVRSSLELEGEMDFLSARLPKGASLWIVYPKQTSRFKVDFEQNDVRAVALAAGLVDYKICSVDADWTGLKFARKRGY